MTKDVMTQQSQDKGKDWRTSSVVCATKSGLSASAGNNDKDNHACDAKNNTNHNGSCGGVIVVRFIIKCFKGHLPIIHCA